jgi:four helix bundle protein
MCQRPVQIPVPGQATTVKNFRELLAWRRSMRLAVRTYRATRMLPSPERYALVAQLERAVVSVPSNIAEGDSRRSSSEYLYHLGVARGSLAEHRRQLLIARAEEISPASEASELLKQSEEVGRLLGGLQRALALKRRREKETRNSEPTRRRSEIGG